MTEKEIIVNPGVNSFRVVGVQQFGTVQPAEFTEGGYPKNTTTMFQEITIDYDPKEGTCIVAVGDGGIIIDASCNWFSCDHNVLGKCRNTDLEIKVIQHYEEGGYMGDDWGQDPVYVPQCMSKSSTPDVLDPEGSVE